MKIPAGDIVKTAFFRPTYGHNFFLYVKTFDNYTFSESSVGILLKENKRNCIQVIKNAKKRHKQQ